jgi:predicted unusual protein kinase regulating ubiquinone biosynthesis (AarF/ABC1/UbiB family)
VAAPPAQARPGTSMERMMAVSLKPSHLKRYKDVALLFMKYGRSDLVQEAGLDDDVDPALVVSGSEPEAEQLAKDLEAMGPTFVKLGQLLSTRAEFLPRPYLDALARLQDDVTPFSFEEVEAIVEEELGVKMSKAFKGFEREPVASASLGQVHRAVLRDGRLVVVKVQRPGIREQVIVDLQSLAELAALLDSKTEVGRRFEFSTMIEEFHKVILAELDYRKEARNLEVLGAALVEFDRIVVPQPVGDYSSERVLTMDYVSGRKITDVSPLRLNEIDGGALAEQLFHAYLQQIFVDGFFHADPHPGNVFLADDGRIALLDLGMVARLAPRLQESLLQMLLAISDGRSDEAADFALKIGERKPQFDETAFRRRVGDLVTHTRGATVAQLQVGRIVMELAQHAGETGVRLPPELTVLGKTLLNLDVIGRTLAPQFDPTASVREQASKLMQQRMLKTMTSGNVLSGALEMKDLVNRLPSRLNRLLDAAANNQLGVKVETGFDASQLVVGIQKVANRITIGLLLAALIVGAALLMRVPTPYTILGYPGLAMLFFLGAVGGGLVLLFQIVLTDIKQIRRGDADRKMALTARTNGGP